jgi:hypothetical protein
VGSTTATRELPSGSTDAALKIIAKGHQRNVDGLIVLEDLKLSAFIVFYRLFLDSILCWLANLGIGWHDGENDSKGIPKPDGQAKSPTQLGEFLCRQLVLLLFLFLFDLLLFLLVSLVFILLTAFFSHRMSPFWRTTWLGRGRQPCAASHKGIIAALALHWNDLKLYG